MPNPKMPDSFFENLCGGRQEGSHARAGDGGLWRVHRLRQYGQKLSTDAIRADGQVGRLTVWGNVFDRGKRRELLASFDRADGHGSLPGLARVRLLAIDRGGVLIAGYERVLVGEGRRAEDAQFRQAWWCVPASIV